MDYSTIMNLNQKFTHKRKIIKNYRFISYTVQKQTLLKIRLHEGLKLLNNLACKFSDRIMMSNYTGNIKSIHIQEFNKQIIEPMILDKNLQSLYVEEKTREFEVLQSIHYFHTTIYNINSDYIPDLYTTKFNRNILKPDAFQYYRDYKFIQLDLSLDKYTGFEMKDLRNLIVQLADNKKIVYLHLSHKNINDRVKQLINFFIFNEDGKKYKTIFIEPNSMKYISSGMTVQICLTDCAKNIFNSSVNMSNPTVYRVENIVGKKILKVNNAKNIVDFTINLYEPAPNRLDSVVPTLINLHLNKSFNGVTPEIEKGLEEINNLILMENDKFIIMESDKEFSEFEDKYDISTIKDLKNNGTIGINDDLFMEEGSQNIKYINLFKLTLKETIWLSKNSINEKLKKTSELLIILKNYLSKNNVADKDALKLLFFKSDKSYTFIRPDVSRHIRLVFNILTYLNTVPKTFEKLMIEKVYYSRQLLNRYGYNYNVFINYFMLLFKFRRRFLFKNDSDYEPFLNEIKWFTEIKAGFTNKYIPKTEQVKLTVKSNNQEYIDGKWETINFTKLPLEYLNQDLIAESQADVDVENFLINTLKSKDIDLTDLFLSTSEKTIERIPKTAIMSDASVKQFDFNSLFDENGEFIRFADDTDESVIQDDDLSPEQYYDPYAFEDIGEIEEWIPDDEQIVTDNSSFDDGGLMDSS